MTASLVNRKERATEGLLERVPPELADRLRAMFTEKMSSPHAKLTYAQALAAWWRIVGVDPVEASREDIRKFLAEAPREYKQTTVSLYLTRLKAFVRWSEGELPEPWKSVKTSRVSRNLRDKILKPEEIKAMVKASNRVKTKAMIAVLYEGALRAGELCSLRIKDLEFTDYGFRIRVRGKTGERVIPLHDSAPYLRAWLQVHPSPTNPEAPLFTGKGLRPIQEAAIYGAVTRAAARAGIKRKVHPHMLRHTRLTELAKKLTEQELKIFAGWEKDSRMASVYVHLSGRDVEESILRKVHGISPEEERVEESPLKPEACPSCGFVNPADADFCLRCGYPLNEGARRKVEERRRELNELIVALLNDPKVRETVLEALTRMGRA